jgi:glycosyltransferase involved in cell wall biosynthesis
MVTAALRRAVAAARRAHQVRWRIPPPFTVAGRGSGRVYYLAPDLVAPSGGVRNIYRHVDELRALGIEASVVHTRSGFRCQWFPHETPIVAAGEVRLGETDVLVLPEVCGPGLSQVPAGVRTVIFNQGAYLTYDFIPFDATEAGAPYAAMPNLAGIIAVSEDSQSVLTYGFPKVPVYLARPVIDAEVFNPSGRSGPTAPPRGRRIAYTVSRRQAEREHVLHMLRARGALEGWELAPIQGRTEAETAEIMRSSAIFFSFSDREGFGLPPAEAMASGCYVVGFTGLGGREFFDPEYCTAVPENDVLAYARAAETAMAAFSDNPAAMATRGRLAAERILARYTSAGLRDDLKTIYEPILNGTS